MQDGDAEATLGGLLERIPRASVDRAEPSTPTTIRRSASRLATASLTTTTGHDACDATCIDVDPASASFTDPRPREPTTTVSASRDAAMSAEAGCA